MKYPKLISVLGACVLFSGLFAQTYPLSENSWDNPEFVDRFLGSYGVLTEIEPKITTEESEIFQTVGEMLDANNMQGAMEAIRAAITPESSAALDYTLGNLLLQSGDYRAGVRAYEDAIRKFPNFLRAYKNAGLAYVQMQNYENGAKYIVKSIELGNQEGDSFGLLGYCYLNIGQNVAALDAYRLAGVMAPNNKDWQVGKATALHRVGLFEEALAKFDELIARDPSSESYYMAAANAAISLQQNSKAAKYLEVLRRRGDPDVEVLMLLGDIYTNQALFSLASDVYYDVLDVASSTQAERIFRFARGLVSYGAYQEAGKFIEKLKQSNLRMGEEMEQKLLNLESQLALATGDSEQAVATLEEVIKTDPLNGEALLLLGKHYYENKDYETAVFYFERAQKIAKFRVDALVQTARVRVAQSQFVEAVGLLQEAQSIEEQSHVEAYLNAVRSAMRASG